MFGLSGIATKVIIFGMIGAAAVGAVSYGVHVIEDRQRLKDELVIKDGIIQSKDNLIKTIKDNAEKQRKELTVIQESNRKVIQENNELHIVIGNGSRFGAIGARKPLILQKKFNRANNSWNKEMRELTK